MKGMNHSTPYKRHAIIAAGKQTVTMKNPTYAAQLLSLSPGGLLHGAQLEANLCCCTSKSSLHRQGQFRATA